MGISEGQMTVFLRRVFFQILHYIGFLRLWRYLHRYHVNILMIHGVMDKGVKSTWQPLRPQLSRKQLERVIKLLSRYYRFVSMDDVVSIINGDIKPEQPCIAITFDDGYRNNYVHALPILKKYGVPSTVYIATGHVEKREPFWFDRMDYAIQQLSPGKWEVDVGGEATMVERGDRITTRDSYKQLRDKSKNLCRDDEMIAEHNRISTYFEQVGGGGIMDVFEKDDWCGVLTWDDVSHAAREGMCIGSHTVDHIRMGAVDALIKRQQLVKSKKDIEREIGQPCVHFCYPNGSCDDDVVPLVEEAGYKSAVLEVAGSNAIGSNVMLLLRTAFPMNESSSDAELIAHCSGLAHVIHTLKENY